MNIIITNIKSYIRFLGRNKVYTAISVLGFAVAISFVLLITSHIYQSLSMDNFHSKRDRIKIAVSNESKTFPNKMADYIMVKCPEAEYYTRVYTEELSIAPQNKEKYMANVMFAEHNFFDMFDFKLKEGNPETALNLISQTVLSEAMAYKEFGEENPLGRHINIGEKEYLITGIFKDFPRNTQFVQPDYIVSYLSLDNTRSDNILHSWNNSSYCIFLLEKEKANLKAKESILLEGLKKDYFSYKMGWLKDFRILSLKDLYFYNSHQELSGNSLKSGNLNNVLLYLAIAILIVIIAILNYINMTAAQSSGRGNEIAMRKLLGAEKKSIISQSLLESLFMITTACLIGIILALIFKPIFEQAIGESIYLGSYLSPLTFFIGICSIIVIAFISGLIPALLVSNYQPIEVIKGGFSHKLKSVYSKIFITFQYIVSLCLLIIGFIIIQQFRFLTNYNIGVDKETTIEIKYPCSAEQVPSLRSEFMKIPEIETVSFCSGTPIDGGNNSTKEINGEQIGIQFFMVDSAFYKIFDINVVSTGVNQHDGVIINQQGINALQVDTTTYIAHFGNETYPIAGIAKDFHFRPLTQPIGPAIIGRRSESRIPWTVLIKLEPNAGLYHTAKQISKTYNSFIGHSLKEVQFIDDTVHKWYERENRLATLITLFTLFSILLTVMGIFAMSLYQVQQRKKEIAVRKVNGATEIQILSLFNLSSIRLILLAFVIAAPISYYITNEWLTNFAYKVSITPVLFIVSLLIIILLTILSVSSVVWRAAVTNPVDSLKSE